MTKIEGEEHGLVGGRVRDRRLMLGIKQADLAARADISPSYLNLIEHNRRRIGGRLLIVLAKGLGVDPQVLSQGAEAELLEVLREAIIDDAISDALGDETAQMEEFAERFPGWAGLIATQKERIAQLEAIIDGLNDRLTHDPVLSDTMHDVLSTASAIRSTASILVATPDIDADWRQRFHANIDTESRRLAETSAAMAEHFEHLTQSRAAYTTPLEATQALFAENGHHFEAIEARGEGAIAEIMQANQMLIGETGRIAGVALRDYAARAAAFPVADLTEQIRVQGFGALAQIAAEKSAPLDMLLVRLAELPHAVDLPDMGCVQSDGAGALVIRNPVAGFPIPRFGAACNLWPVFSAIATPSQPIRRVVRSSEDVRFTTFSVATLVQPPSFDAPPIFRSTMLIVADAPEDEPLDIGPACRVCPHQACAARREPSILDSIAANG